ncbi:MAG: hypothetical protein WAM92_17010 [Mycobacterium sp.]
MVGIPAWVWRFGLTIRALIVGPAVGIVIGLLALFGSNSVPAGLVAFVVVSLLYGAIMGRRMAKFWPGAKQLSGADRVAVARATRSGRDIGDARLAAGVIDYSRSLHRAAEGFRLWWWLILVLGVVALGTAIADTIFAPVREAVISWLYFAFFPIEALWWPRRQAQILANAERAADAASRLIAR